MVDNNGDQKWSVAYMFYHSKPSAGMVINVSTTLLSEVGE